MRTDEHQSSANPATAGKQIPVRLITWVLLGALCGFPDAGLSETASPSERVAELSKQWQTAESELQATRQTVARELYQKWGYFEFEKLIVTLPKQISRLRFNLENEARATPAYKEAVDQARLASAEHAKLGNAATDYSGNTNLQAAIRRPNEIFKKHVDGNSQLAELRRALKEAEARCGQMRASAPAVVAADERVKSATAKEAEIAGNYQLALGDLQRLKAQEAEASRQTQLLEDQNKKLEEQKVIMEEQRRLLEQSTRALHDLNNRRRIYQ